MTLLKELGYLALATRIRTLGDTMLADGLQIYAGLGLNFQPRWFSVFYLLQEHHELPVTEVASRIGLSHPAIIKIIESMEEAGLIESGRNSRDARKRMITLSAKGEALIPELQPVWKALEEELKQLFADLNIDILGVLESMERMIQEKPISKRVQERYRRNFNLNIAFRPYSKELAPAFKSLNEEWLTEYFTIEDEDRRMLDQPDQILEEGGTIVFACLGDETVGTFALMALSDGVFELAKMAVTRRHRNRGIGQLMLKKALEEAQTLGARSLILHTSAKLEAANHIYGKFGFVEDRLTAQPMKYLRPSRRFVLDLVRSS
ncbi:bifunctional helix-turn-helix transcriptional regulator/GNAT family N-acetyltransferase [Oligoflexus tunisiensis]|uniref:bifunctional helix-turn-helix transcriptional regulator/GNAT family N-acetyltransferase n=1 Tax=Oligoflexus tunisiensis TaxID=708132 RepID=UPI00114C9F20|nr:bifunctional helix-turn-helix transcriptional regulator/GNAT family N-acetyltransferase [Oligoflexus tunisiensis]